MATIKFNPHSPSEYTINGKTYRNLEAQVLANTIALTKQASEEVIQELTNRVSALESTTIDLSNEIIDLSTLGLTTLGAITSAAGTEFADFNSTAYFNKFASLSAAAMQEISNVPTTQSGGVLITFANNENVDGTVDVTTYIVQMFFAANEAIYYRKGTINTPSTVSFGSWTQTNASLLISIDGGLPHIYNGSEDVSITFTNGNIIYY